MVGALVDQQLMKIAIGIPTFRRPWLLSKALRSLTEQTFKGSFSLVIADNDSEGREGFSTATAWKTDVVGFDFFSSIDVILVIEKGVK